MRPTLRWLSHLATSPSRTSSTSFIGLGRMGSEMAYNLFSKQLVAATAAASGRKQEPKFVICDALPDSARSFADSFSAQFPNAKIEIVNTPVEATLASKTVITMLPSSPHVQQVYGENIVPTLRKLAPSDAAQTLCIDSTTLDVDVARSVASDVRSTGAQMVDAPVSGGVAGAKAGTLSFLVGGPEQSFNAAKPFLEFMGQRIIHCGPSGAGLGAKICNNLVLGVQQVVIAEAMLLGDKIGLEPSVLASVINSSTGGCWASSVNNPVKGALPDRSPPPPCERDFEGGFVTALMLKDMGLATDIGKKHTSPLPLGEAAEALYARSIEERPELAKKDFSSIYRYLQTKAEVSSN